jgi:hypothetical protein
MMRGVLLVLRVRLGAGQRGVGRGCAQPDGRREVAVAESLRGVNGAIGAANGTGRAGREEQVSGGEGDLGWERQKKQKRGVLSVFLPLSDQRGKETKTKINTHLEEARLLLNGRFAGR